MKLERSCQDVRMEFSSLRMPTLLVFVGTFCPNVPQMGLYAAVRWTSYLVLKLTGIHSERTTVMDM